jgi:hypothetical protein
LSLTTFRTLHKIHTFIEAQQNRGKLKRFLGQGDMTTLLKDCKTGLQQSQEVFQVGHIIVLATTNSKGKYVDQDSQSTHGYCKDARRCTEQTLRSAQHD